MDTNGKPTVISIFCGTGGSSLGYKWAGYRELLAIDNESHAVECFKLNFPEIPVWHKSVVNIIGKDILEFCNIKAGELDVLDGSPPCQGFSTAGKRQVRDPRNDLFNHYVRLVSNLQPKVFIMENVTGMAKGRMKGKFIEIMKILKNLNYNVKCKKMNSMYYRVPQSRERLIFMGIRKDIEKDPLYPIASTRLITVREALQDLEISEKKNRRVCTPGLIKLARQLNPGESGSKYHPRGSCFGLIRLNPSRPSNTIIKSAGTGLLHYSDYLNFISVNEIKRLCSFPISWKLGPDRSKAVDRLGNSVMPKFMQAIAETVKKEILNGTS